MRILDVISHTAGRIIGQGDNGFLYFARPSHSDPFTALKRATLEPEAQKWLLWDIGAGEDLDEIAGRLKDECKAKFGFPYRTKATPA